MSGGRRRAGDFDLLLDAWARWLADTRCSMGAGGGSLLARWMDAEGHLIFSGGGGSHEPVDTIEASIEIAVVEMGKNCQLREDVLRLEYAAGFSRVVMRRALVGWEPGGTQMQNALAMGVGLRTYKLRLAEARAYVAKRLGKKIEKTKEFEQ